MEDLIKKISYLKGLAEGSGVDSTSAEGKLINEIINYLSELTDYVAEIDEDLGDAEDRIEECEDYLDIIADDFYDEDGNPYESDDSFEISDEDEDDIFDFSDDDDSEDDSDFFEIECPGCGEDVLIDFDSIDDDNGIICPNCHKEIVLEFDTEADSEDEE